MIYILPPKPFVYSLRKKIYGFVMLFCDLSQKIERFESEGKFAKVRAQRKARVKMRGIWK
jgi:hypothetical protein